MLESLIAADDITYGALLNGGPVERRERSGMLVHRIGTRYLAVQTAGAPHLWSRLLALIGRPELAQDARFATPMARRENWSALSRIYRDWLDGFADVDAAVTALTTARIPAVPMLTPEEVVEHPHLAARAAFPAVSHPARSSVRVTATPFHVDGAPTHPAGAAPYRVGQHTQEVLAQVLGYDAQRIAALRGEGVIEFAEG
jgi:crotonobetainyl-CoA:carnitine CoA-transferase CaiB-like acyl-CoA transferase